MTRDEVKYARPEPGLFLTAASRLGVAIEASAVVGDSERIGGIRGAGR